MAQDGSLYIADQSNQRIRRVGPDGIINTIAGNGTFGFSGDGSPATQAALNNPSAIAVAADGSFYLVDRSNFRVRRVGPDGIITTVAGNGIDGFSGDGGPATQASIGGVFSIALASDGSLYIGGEQAIQGVNNQRIRRVGPDGIITTVAGNGAFGFSGDGGLATQARLFTSRGLAVASDSTLYIADQGSSHIRGIGPDGIITIVAGNGTFAFSGDGGPAAQAALSSPMVLPWRRMAACTSLIRAMPAYGA